MSESLSHPTDVSVIIPTYNRLWCLPQAVASCRGSNAKIEIVVIDDGSNDGTWEWLSEQRDVRALRQPNRGKDWAIALGMSVARGRYVKFLDSDDAILPGAIDAQLRIADDTAADVVVSGMLQVDDAGNVDMRTEYAPTDDFIAQQLGEGDHSHYSAFLFRREFVASIPHRQEFGALDDRMFMIEVALRHPRLAVVPGQALLHVRHSRERLQVASGLRQVVKNYCHIQVYRAAVAQLVATGELTPRRAAAVAMAVWPVAGWLAATHPGEACEVVDWIKELSPTFVPPDNGILGVCFRRLGFNATQRLLRLRRKILAPIRRSARALSLALPQQR